MSDTATKNQPTTTSAAPINEAVTASHRQPPRGNGEATGKFRGLAISLGIVLAVVLVLLIAGVAGDSRCCSPAEDCSWWSPR